VSDDRPGDRVQCDENCGAYQVPDPDSLKELRAALEHWEDHTLMGGCSHAR